MRQPTHARALLAVTLLTLTAASAPAAAAPLRLTLDRDHTSITFSVRHVLTKVQGRFSEFEGTIDFDEPAIAASRVKAKIQTASVDTNVAKRDADLRSARFFDVERYPAIEFSSTRVVPGEGKHFKLEGTLSMHGMTKPVVLDAEYLGSAKDPWGNPRYAFHAATRINRQDFGMRWNEALEAGGVLVGDEIDIALDIEAVPAL